MFRSMLQTLGSWAFTDTLLVQFKNFPLFLEARQSSGTMSIYKTHTTPTIVADYYVVSAVVNKIC